MDAVQVITDIVSQIETNDSPETPLAFFYGDKAEQNLIGDNQVFPSVLMDFPFEYSFDVYQSGYIAENTLLGLFFCNKAPIDATPVQHKIIIEEMKQYARKFLAGIQKSDYIHTFKDVRGNGVENYLDVNVSGFLLQLSIEFFNVDSNCF